MTRKRSKERILYIGQKLPALWIRKQIVKWKKEFGLYDWAFNIYYKSQRGMNKKFSDQESDIVGHASSLTQYLFARLYFSSTLKNDSFGRETVFHEVRHVYYESVLERLRNLEALIAPSKREAFSRVLDSLIEEMIERDILFYKQHGKI